MEVFLVCRDGNPIGFTDNESLAYAMFDAMNQKEPFAKITVSIISELTKTKLDDYNTRVEMFR